MVVQKRAGGNRCTLAPIRGEGYTLGMRNTMQCLILVVTLLTLPCPTPAADGPAPDMDVMIGQMLMAGFRGTTVTEDSPIARDIRDRHLGGVILFDRDVASGSSLRNIESPEQLTRLTARLHGLAAIPLFVAIDQEGGRVQRLRPERGFFATPSARELGSGSDAVVRETGARIGHNLAALGINVDFAPVVDVDVNPDSPAIGRLDRSFSADPQRVARCAELFLDGLSQASVVGCLKHFPGHGSAGTDSHQGLTDVTDTWLEEELIPYRELVEHGAARMIMTAHIVNRRLDPDRPATLSHRVITDLLRRDIGFAGVVVTDDLNMGAIADHYGLEQTVRLAILAGADILLFGNNLEYDPYIVAKAHALISRMVTQGTITPERVRASYRRIMAVKSNLPEAMRP